MFVIFDPVFAVPPFPRQNPINQVGKRAYKTNLARHKHGRQICTWLGAKKVRVRDHQIQEREFSFFFAKRNDEASPAAQYATFA